MEAEYRRKKIVRVTIVGSIVNVMLVLFKFAAGILGRSSAMIADAVHSLSDFATDLVVLLFINISAKPKDEDHAYGHGKYETLATAVIGLVLLGVGIGLCWSGINKITGYYMRGEELGRPGIVALIAALLSIIAKEAVYQYTLRVAKKVDSLAVVANAWHHRSDAFSSIGTALGIGGAILLGEKWRILDPLAAVIVSVFIIKVAFQLVIPALNDLLEKSLPVETEEEILSIVENTPGVYFPHNLRTRRIGNSFAIELHIRVEGDMSVDDAHLLTLEVEKALREKFGPSTHIALHVEPLKNQ